MFRTSNTCFLFSFTYTILICAFKIINVVYGMNFAEPGDKDVSFNGYGMPELDWKYGYVGYFWGVTVLITVFMMLLLLTKDVVRCSKTRQCFLKCCPRLYMCLICACCNFDCCCCRRRTRMERVISRRRSEMEVSTRRFLMMRE